MKECLGCWEEIEDDQEICHHCGSKQEEVKDYLALVLLKQSKKKIDVPKESPVLEYVSNVDPTIGETISTSIKPSKPKKSRFFPALNQKAGTQQDGVYSPERPGWLARPPDQKDTDNEKPKELVEPDKSKSIEKKPRTKPKTIACPKCSEDVPLLQYCKLCGHKLLRNCPKCNKEIAVTAKFCTGCGTKVEPFLDKKENND